MQAMSRTVDADTAPGTKFNEWLATSPYRACRSLSAEVTAGILVLSGSLPTYYLKQIAQTEALRLSGGIRIVNQITVVNFRSHG